MNTVTNRAAALQDVNTNVFDGLTTSNIWLNVPDHEAAYAAYAVKYLKYMVSLNWNFA